MTQFTLDLVLTATEGSIHGLGTLICMAWLTANTHNPLHQDAGRAAVLSRTESGWGPLQARELRVPTQELGQVVDQMRRLGLPVRPPRIQAQPGNRTGWQEITLDLSLDGQHTHLAFPMQYAGLEGDDVRECRALLESLGRLLGVPVLGQWAGEEQEPPG